MGIYAIPISMILCTLITTIEIKRYLKKKEIDMLTGVSIIYLICFGITPITIFFSDLSYYSTTHLIKQLPLDNIGFLFASIGACIGYLFILMGYYFKKRFKIAKYPKKEFKKGNYYAEKDLNIVSLSLFIIGTISLFIYIYSIGGVKTALETATLYRSGIGPVNSKWLFLKNVAPLIMISSYIYYSLIKDYPANKKRYYLMFLISFILSVYLLFIMSGRLSLVMYIIVFPFHKMLNNDKKNMKIILFIILFGLLTILFGNTIFDIFKNSSGRIEIAQITTNNFGSILDVLLKEFSFPFINLVNLMNPTRIISFRYFSDVLIGIFSLLPQSLLNIKIPLTLSELNTQYFSTTGTIPVDLISFGYYSFNIPGIIIISFVFGSILRFFDELFTSDLFTVDLIFRSAWFFFLAFRIMYGDMSLIMQGGFKLFVGTYLLIRIRKN